MKLIKIILVLTMISTLVGGAFYYYQKTDSDRTLSTSSESSPSGKKYIIQKIDRVVDEADTLEDAVSQAEKIKRSVVINTYTDEWVYTNLQPFMIIAEYAVHDFSEFGEALSYAKKNGYENIYYKDNKTIVWSKYPLLQGMQPMDVPLIQQNPQLPRGCEVTSLAMILNYAGIEVDKMTLAAEVAKDTTPYSVNASGRITYGNPYDGFVGDMYNWTNNGYGVYHGPILELAQKYVSEAAIDLTGADFEEVLFLVEEGYPAWVITNATFKALAEEEFQIWHTPTGIVKITSKLHAVVITGFNDEIIYINDPLKSRKNIGLPRKDFELAWEQLGNQSVVILK